MIPPRAVWKIRPSRGGAVPLDVGAQQFHQFGRVGDGTGLMDGAVLQSAFLPGCDSADGLPGTAEPHSDFRLGALRVPRLPHFLFLLRLSRCRDVYPGAAIRCAYSRALPWPTREGKRADWPGREAGGPYSRAGTPSAQLAQHLVAGHVGQRSRPVDLPGRPGHRAGRVRPGWRVGRPRRGGQGGAGAGASDEPLGNLTAILRICRAGVRRLLPWRLRCRGIAPGRSGVPGLRRSCRPLAWAKRERRQSMR
jgi:hypothetical protein